MHSQLITIFQEMVSVLGDASDSFGGDVVVWHDCMYEPVANINV